MLVDAERLVGAEERWSWNGDSERWWLDGHSGGRAAERAEVTSGCHLGWIGLVDLQKIYIEKS